MKIDDRYITDARERMRKKAQNEATCFALNDMLKDAQEEVRRLREENERLHAATSQQSPGPDCRTCANRGRVNGLSQETYCDGCVWYGAYWKKNHYNPIPEPAP